MENVRCDSNNPELMKAYIAETHGDYHTAIDLYKSVIAGCPEMGVAYKHCGNEYYRIGNLNEAVYYLEKAVELMPNYPTPLYELALAYYRLVKIRPAIDCMKKVIEMDDEFLVAHYWLGVFNYYYGHIREAKSNYITVTKKNPNFTIAYYYLYLLFQLDSG